MTRIGVARQARRDREADAGRRSESAFVFTFSAPAIRAGFGAQLPAARRVRAIPRLHLPAGAEDRSVQAAQLQGADAGGRDSCSPRASSMTRARFRAALDAIGRGTAGSAQHRFRHRQADGTASTALADETYAELLHRLADRKFAARAARLLRRNIVAFYALAPGRIASRKERHRARRNPGGPRGAEASRTGTVKCRVSVAHDPHARRPFRADARTALRGTIRDVRSLLTGLIFLSPPRIVFVLAEAAVRRYAARNAMVAPRSAAVLVGDDYGPMPPWLDRLLILRPDDRADLEEHAERAARPTSTSSARCDRRGSHRAAAAVSADAAAREFRREPDVDDRAQLAKASAAPSSRRAKRRRAAHRLHRRLVDVRHERRPGPDVSEPSRGAGCSQEQPRHGRGR